MNQENKYMIDDLQVHPAQLPSDSYFEALKKNVLKEIHANGLKKNEAPRIIPMYKRWYVWGSAAAILAFALLFPWNTATVPETASGSVNLSSVSDQEIYDYLDQNIEDLDPETIAVHLNSDRITWDESPGKENPEMHPPVLNKTILLDDVKDEEILDYLKNESGELDEYLLIES